MSLDLARTFCLGGKAQGRNSVQCYNVRDGGVSRRCKQALLLLQHSGRG